MAGAPLVRRHAGPAGIGFLPHQKAIRSAVRVAGRRPDGQLRDEHAHRGRRGHGDACDAGQLSTERDRRRAFAPGDGAGQHAHVRLQDGLRGDGRLYRIALIGVPDSRPDVGCADGTVCNEPSDPVQRRRLLYACLYPGIHLAGAEAVSAHAADAAGFFRQRARAHVVQHEVERH